MYLGVRRVVKKTLVNQEVNVKLDHLLRRGYLYHQVDQIEANMDNAVIT